MNEGSFGFPDSNSGHTPLPPYQRYNFSASGRAASTPYTNDTGRAITVILSAITSYAGGAATFTVAGVTQYYAGAFYSSPTQGMGGIEFTVLPGETYSCNMFNTWVEIR